MKEWGTIFIAISSVVVFLLILELVERGGFRKAYENCITHNKTMSVEDARALCKVTVYGDKK